MGRPGSSATSAPPGLEVGPQTRHEASAVPGAPWIPGGVCSLSRAERNVCAALTVAASAGRGWGSSAKHGGDRGGTHQITLGPQRRDRLPDELLPSTHTLFSGVFSCVSCPITAQAHQP